MLRKERIIALYKKSTDAFLNGLVKEIWHFLCDRIAPNFYEGLSKIINMSVQEVRELREESPEGLDHYFEQWKEIFISENARDLAYLSKISDGRMEMLGEGWEGIAWSIGNDSEGMDSKKRASGQKVLKIYNSRILFEDKTEARNKNVWGGYGASRFGGEEAMVHASGKFLIGGKQCAVWKVMEEFDSTIGSDDDFKNCFNYLIEKFDTINRKLHRKGIGIETANPNEVYKIFSQEALPFIEDNMIKKSLSDKPDLMNKCLKSFHTLDERWGRDWRKKFIHSLVRGEVDGKADFGVNNVGIRPSTGAFVWFDG